MSTGFLSRLDDASSSLRAERKDITPVRPKHLSNAAQTQVSASASASASPAHMSVPTAGGETSNLADYDHKGMGTIRDGRHDGSESKGFSSSSSSSSSSTAGNNLLAGANANANANASSTSNNYSSPARSLPVPSSSSSSSSAVAVAVAAGLDLDALDESINAGIVRAEQISITRNNLPHASSGGGRGGGGGASYAADRKDQHCDFAQIACSKDGSNHRDRDRDRDKDASDSDRCRYSDRDGDRERFGDVEPKEDENLVSLCAEYIFDLFDANMMDDYHAIAEFESRALDAFPDHTSEEISFAQEGLHKEFLTLFEKLIGGFLEQNGSTVEAFYGQVSDYLHRPVNDSRDQAKKTSADEVVDVIFCYTDLRMWCDAMRERAAIRAKYYTNFQKHILQQEQQEQLQRQQLAGPGTGASTSTSASASGALEHGQHRREVELTREALPATAASIAAAACVQPNAAYLAYKSQLEEAAILMANERRQQSKPTPAKNHRLDR